MTSQPKPGMKDSPLLQKMKAEIHFFHSGNGDSILIRGGEEWGLVDANFVKCRRVRQRVETILEGVDRLRFVCITHLDLDHIRGLVKFLEDRFSDLDLHGRRIWRIDQVLCPLFPTTLETIAKLKEWARSPYANDAFDYLEEYSEEMSQEANSLFDMLCEMAVQSQQTKTVGEVPEFPNLWAGKVLYGPPPMPRQNRMGPWKITCLGPMDRTFEIYSGQIQNKFLNSEPLDEIFGEVKSNATSRVLAFQHHPTDYAVILTGDSTIEELDSAIATWKQLDGRTIEPFRTVKVSHHGAKSCHLPELFENECHETATIAIICAEDDGVHPDKEVIECISRNVRSCLVTGTGSFSPIPKRREMGIPLGLPHRDAEAEDIVVSLTEEGLVTSGGCRSRFERT